MTVYVLINCELGSESMVMEELRRLISECFVASLYSKAYLISWFTSLYYHQIWYKI